MLLAVERLILVSVPVRSAAWACFVAFVAVVVIVGSAVVERANQNIVGMPFSCLCNRYLVVCVGHEKYFYWLALSFSPQLSCWVRYRALQVKSPLKIREPIAVLLVAFVPCLCFFKTLAFYAIGTAAIELFEKLRQQNMFQGGRGGGAEVYQSLRVFRIHGLPFQSAPHNWFLV